jgi:hypothetical protein
MQECADAFNQGIQDGILDMKSNVAGLRMYDYLKYKNLDNIQKITEYTMNREAIENIITNDRDLYMGPRTDDVGVVVDTEYDVYQKIYQWLHDLEHSVKYDQVVRDESQNTKTKKTNINRSDYDTVEIYNQLEFEFNKLALEDAQQENERLVKTVQIGTELDPDHIVIMEPSTRDQTFKKNTDIIDVVDTTPRDVTSDLVYQLMATMF